MGIFAEATYREAIEGRAQDRLSRPYRGSRP